MAQTSTGLSGRYTIDNNSVVWHELHNTRPGYAGIHTEGTIYFNRDTASKTINVTGKPINTLVGSSAFYDYDIHLGLLRNVTQTSSTNNSVDRSNLYATSYQLIPYTEVNLGRPGNNPNINISFESTINEIIYVAYKCGQNGGCTAGYGGTSGNPHSDWVLVGSIDTSNIPYYTKHTYSINSVSPTIGIHNSTQFTVNYSIYGGTNSLSWVQLRVYNTSNQLIDTFSCGTGTGQGLNQSFTLNNNFTDGQQYKVSVRFYDGYAEYETGTLSFYTYRTPILSNVSLSDTNFSGFGNVTLSWQTNQRRWNTNPTENPFQTYLKFGTDNVWFLGNNSNPVGPSTSNEISYQTQMITQNIINSHFSVEQRCQQEVDTTLQVRRNNPSSGVNTDSSTLNITVQFSPKYLPNQISYWDYNSTSSNNRGNSINQGSLCYLDEHPKIVIDWSIPNNIDRGIIDGYELHIYSDDSYTDHKTFDINVGGINTDLYGQYIADIRKDLYRGQMNYIGVKAYYINPKGEKMYGPELKQQFILPIGKLYKPVISYPINNSQWHNKNFRILFELPQDDDYDVLDEYIQNDTYEYKEIIVTINNNEYKYSENPNIFSINKMGYKYKVCVNPSIISSFEDTNTYQITVKVQKNYFTDIWSETSDITTLYKLSINRQDLQKDMLVMATHYKYVQSSSIRLYNTYPINVLPENNVDQNRGDIIYAKHFQAIFDTILTIQDGVNNWARYDEGKDKCKFQQTIDKFLGTNKATLDIITAQDDERPTRKGRNYFNILVECMNKLY